MLMECQAEREESRAGSVAGLGQLGPGRMPRRKVCREQRGFLRILSYDAAVEGASGDRPTGRQRQVPSRGAQAHGAVSRGRPCLGRRDPSYHVAVWAELGCLTVQRKLLAPDPRLGQLAGCPSTGIRGVWADRRGAQTSQPQTQVRRLRSGSGVWMFWKPGGRHRGP